MTDQTTTPEPSVRTVLIEDGQDAARDLEVKILGHHVTDDPDDRVVLLAYVASDEGRIALSVDRIRRILAAVDDGPQTFSLPPEPPIGTTVQGKTWVYARTSDREDGYRDSGQLMDLYCWPHSTTHRFTAGEVEKIVYAFVADHADLLTEADGDRNFAGKEASQNLPCLRDVLRWADDPEVYLEHVEQGVECRRALVRECAAPERGGKQE